MQICDFFLHERFKGVCIGTTGSFPVAVAEPSIKGDHQCSGVKRKPCLTLKQVDTKVNENEV